MTTRCEHCGGRLFWDALDKRSVCGACGRGDFWRPSALMPPPPPQNPRGRKRPALCMEPECAVGVWKAGARCKKHANATRAKNGWETRRMREAEA